MANVKVKGIIIKMTNFKDYDKYINVLTRDLGLISVYCKGIRRPKNRLNSFCQLFSFNEFELFYNKERYSLDDAASIQTFKSIQKDIYLLTASSEIAEIMIDNLPQGERILDNFNFYEFMLRCLYEFDKNIKDPRLISNVAEFKLCCELGYKPILGKCFYCENYLDKNDDIVFIDIENARLYCERHAHDITRNRKSNSCYRISPALLAALRYIVNAESNKVFSFTLNEKVLQELSIFTKHYLAEHFTKNYDKLAKLDMFF